MLLQLTNGYIQNSGKDESVILLDEKLKKIVKLNLDNSEKTDDDCSTKFAAFTKFHSSGDGILIFPDYPSINSKATDQQINSQRH